MLGPRFGALPVLKSAKVGAVRRIEQSGHHSQHLLDGQGTDLSSAEQSRQTKRRKVLKDDDIHSTSSPCAAESSSRNKVLGSLPVNRRHSKRVTASELGKRESILLKKEEECDRRAEELDERCRSVKKLEAETSLRVLHAHRRETRGVLSQLEDHYTCAL